MPMTVNAATPVNNDPSFSGIEQKFNTNNQAKPDLMATSQNLQMQVEVNSMQAANVGMNNNPVQVNNTVPNNRMPANNMAPNNNSVPNNVGGFSVPNQAMAPSGTTGVPPIGNQGGSGVPNGGGMVQPNFVPPVG